MQIIHIYTIESPLAIIFRFFFYSNREISFSHEIRRTDCYAKLIFCLNNEFIVLMSRMENQIKHKNHFAITFAVFHSNKLKLFIKIWPIKENKLKIVYFVYTFLISARATSIWRNYFFFRKLSVLFVLLNFTKPIQSDVGTFICVCACIASGWRHEFFYRNIYIWIKFSIAICEWICKCAHWTYHKWT